MKNLIALVFTAALTLPVAAQAQNSAAQGDWLVSPAEAMSFKGEDGFNEPPALRARALVPQIDIIKPEPVADLKVKAPFAIAVQIGRASCRERVCNGV